MSKVAELEKRLADKREERAKGREAQYEKDLEARILLEDEFGAIASVEASRFVAGQPTFALVRTPNLGEYKRYKSQIFKSAHTTNKASAAKEKVDAQELLATSCWVYPIKKEEREAMLEVYPGILTPLSLAAAALAEGKSEEEGKE